MNTIHELPQADKREQESAYITNFDTLRGLGSTEFEGGTEVSFQPYKRLPGKRHVGTIRLSDEDPNTLTLRFYAELGGFSQPDGEHITREKFPEMMDHMQIREEVAE